MKDKRDLDHTLRTGLFAGNDEDINDDGIPLPKGTITGLGTITSVISAGFLSPGSPSFDYHLSDSSPINRRRSG